MQYKTLKLKVIIGILNYLVLLQAKSEGPFLATGIKIGEVTQNEAIVWVRLTEKPNPTDRDATEPIIRYKDPESGKLLTRDELPWSRADRIPVVKYPEGYNTNNIPGATPGSKGQVRLKYRSKNKKNWNVIGWQRVDSQKDYTYQFKLSDLTAGKNYQLTVEASPMNNNKVTASIDGEFTTAPSRNSPEEINFIVTTGTSYGDTDSKTGYKLYQNSLKLDPEFFVHTGDIVYYDGYAKNIELARWHWERQYSYPNNINFHKQVASYFIKDDHDTWVNDCYPDRVTRFMGDFTFEQGLKVFLEQVPMGNKTYRTIRWGKDLQIWLVEGRDYRSPNPMPDGPRKSIWGKEQLEWFISTVHSSDATYKVLISPTPIVGPDRKGKNDNHANSGFEYEGDLIREFMAQQKNMVSVCGDRHWQYVSKDKETGLLEFSCGPGSHEHAGGWDQNDKRPEHIYLNVVGGFMEGSISRVNGQAILIFRHYDPDGKLLNEYTLQPE